MALGIIDAIKFERELKRFAEGKSKFGRYGKVVPQEIRALVAQEAIAGAPVAELMTDFNIGETSVAAYKHGTKSTGAYNKLDSDLLESNNQFKEKIKTLASEKLIAAINSITPEKLANAKVNIASAVARDMSTVAKNMEPQVENQQNMQVVIYSPRERNEDDYEIIDVR